MFLVELPKLADLTTRYGFEYMFVISRALHQLINFWHRAFAIPLCQPLQKVGSDMITLVPATPTRTPMRGLKTRTKADPICDALNETARTGALAVVLVTVDDFVDQNAADFIGATFGAVYDVLA
jgi:hypothetical protein